MKKPINRFAVALWILAALFAVTDIGIYLLTLPVGYVAPLVLFGNVLGTAMRALLFASQPAALGIIIELIDQIRWSKLPGN